MHLKIKYLMLDRKQIYYSADYNKFTKDIINNQIKNKNLVIRSDIADFISQTELNEEVSK